MNKPLLPADHAGRLLDEVIFERILDCIDLEALFVIERQLWEGLEACGVGEDDVPRLAKGVIDRALRRLCDDPRRYASFNPFAPDVVGDDCARVEAEIRREDKRNEAGYSLMYSAGGPCALCDIERAAEAVAKRRKASG